MSESYQPIPGIEDGYTALQLYAPGEFMSMLSGWRPFVGGNGVGVTNTVEEGRALLLAKAIGYCDRYINDAHQTLEHYQQQKDKLLRDGLGQF